MCVCIHVWCSYVRLCEICCTKTFAQELMCSPTSSMYMHVVCLFFVKCAQSLEIPKSPSRRELNQHETQANCSITCSQWERQVRMRSDDCCWQVHVVHIMSTALLCSCHKCSGIPWFFFFFSILFLLLLLWFCCTSSCIIILLRLDCLFLNQAEWVKCLGFNKSQIYLI